MLEHGRAMKSGRISNRPALLVRGLSATIRIHDTHRAITPLDNLHATIIPGSTITDTKECGKDFREGTASARGHVTPQRS